MTDYRGTVRALLRAAKRHREYKPAVGRLGVFFERLQRNKPPLVLPYGPNGPEDQIQQDGRTWRFKLTYRLPASRDRNSR